MSPLIPASIIAALAFGSGYATHAWLNPPPPSTQAAQATASGAIKQADKATVATLAKTIKAATTHESTRIQQINEARNAAPTPAADCRLPDGLRDALNADLAAGAVSPAAEVPAGGRDAADDR